MSGADNTYCDIFDFLCPQNVDALHSHNGTLKQMQQKKNEKKKKTKEKSKNFSRVFNDIHYFALPVIRILSQCTQELIFQTQIANSQLNTNNDNTR